MEVRRTNGAGTTGFVLSLLCYFLGWIPVIGWIVSAILWLLGLIFSIIGVCRAPRGLAITGLILSIIYFFVFFIYIGGFAAVMSNY